VSTSTFRNYHGTAASRAFTLVNPPSPAAALEATISECWSRPVEQWLGPEGYISPAGDFSSWEEKLLPLLALLAETTVGQPDEAYMRLFEVIQARGADKTVKVADLVNVIQGLYT
jgi:hypothetical protein